MMWLTKDVSIRLLARTAGRTWVRCCSGRTVRNSESLRGLRCTLQERWGRGKARALLGPLAVRTYRTGAKALSGQSRADVQTRAKALSGQSRADERTGQKAEAKILFTNPSARAGYDTRSIFKRSLTGLNSEFSFS